jgi:thiazole tautomerase (transcriptional regulator TenI)
MGDLPVVHVITDDAVLALPDFSARAAAVLSALGVQGALHLRGHASSGRRLFDAAELLAPLAARAGTMLIINDRIDIALATGASGVQVGERSLAVADVRRVAPRLRVGESVHEAKATQADWVIAGHVFDTPSHATEAPRGLAFVRKITNSVNVPVLAIGGVKASDVAALRNAGAYGVAVIRGVWDAADSAEAARLYLRGFSAIFPS